MLLKVHLLVLAFRLKTRYNAPTNVYIFKNFPGVIPRTPCYKGEEKE